MSKKIRQNLFPVLAALIWGTAFVAQSVSAGHIPPLTFGTIRCSMAFAALALGLWIVRMVQKKKAPEKVEPLADSPKDRHCILFWCPFLACSCIKRVQLPCGSRWCWPLWGFTSCA